MDITRSIEYNHEKIRKYIHDLEAMDHASTALRKPLFEMLKKELMILQQAEEDTLYHALERRDEANALLHTLEEENDTIQSLLESLEKRKPNTEDWHSDFKKLKREVFQHFNKEEDRLLPKAQRALPTREITEEFDDEKRALWKTSTLVEKVSACKDFSKIVRAA